MQPKAATIMKKANVVTSLLKRRSFLTCRSFTSSTILSAEPDNLQYYARKKQTNVSLKALMETGNGKFIEDVKTGVSSSLSDEASANEKILIQVILCSKSFLSNAFPPLHFNRDDLLSAYREQLLFGVQ